MELPKDSKAQLFMMQIYRIKELYKLRIEAGIHPYLTPLQREKDTHILFPTKRIIYAKQGYQSGPLCVENLYLEKNWLNSTI